MPDDHDDDLHRGLAFDLGSMVSRRTVLVTALGAGAAALLAACGDDDAASTSTTQTHRADDERQRVRPARQHADRRPGRSAAWRVGPGGGPPPGGGGPGGGVAAALRRRARRAV